MGVACKCVSIAKLNCRQGQECMGGNMAGVCLQGSLGGGRGVNLQQAPIGQGPGFGVGHV